MSATCKDHLDAFEQPLAAYDRARRLELRESHLESELTRAQIDALHLDIQPHFLFNTLNSIAALIRAKNNPGALSMLVGLSEMMRTIARQVS